MSRIRRRWLPRTKLTVSLLLLGLFLFLLYQFRIVIGPFVLAAVLSYVISPLVTLLERRFRVPRGLATGVIYLLILVAMVMVPVLVIPPLVAQIAGLNVDIQLFLQEVATLFGHQYVIAGQVIDGVAVFDQVIRFVQELLQPLFGETLGFAFGVIESLVWVVFIIVVSFYLVKDGPELKKWVQTLPPPWYREDALRLMASINNIWAAFFRGQLVLALVVATIFTLIGLIIGLPSPFAMGVFAGLMEFFPSVGHAIWLVTATIIALFAGSTWMQIPNWVFALVIIGLHLVFQQFDLNYLIPRVIGRQVHLPPLVVILGIVAGAAMAGVLGVALAAPTIASARVLGRYIFANLFDLDPFPTEVASPLPPPDPRWWAIQPGRKSENNDSLEEDVN